MAAGTLISATIELRRVDRATAARIVAQAISGDSGYQSSAVGDHGFQFSRVYRPTWATVAGWIFTIGLLGGGFWLFLIKRTETCNVSVGEERALVKVAVTGSLLPDVYARLRRDLAAAEGVVLPSGDFEEPRAVAPIAVAVRVAEPISTDRTISLPSELGIFETDDLLPSKASRSFVAPRSDPAPALIDLTEPDALVPSAIETWPAVQFADGLLVRVNRVIFVGRDPLDVDDARRRVQSLAVVDPTGTVSKTHFAMGAGPAGLWIEDLHSTNGTAVGGDLGSARRLTPGERVAVPVGQTIFFGDLVAFVLAGDDRRVVGSAPPSRPPARG